MCSLRRSFQQKANCRKKKQQTNDHNCTHSMRTARTPSLSARAFSRDEPKESRPRRGDQRNENKLNRPNAESTNTKSPTARGKKARSTNERSPQVGTRSAIARSPQETDAAAAGARRRRKRPSKETTRPEPTRRRSCLVPSSHRDGDRLQQRATMQTNGNIFVFFGYIFGSR